jgi:hypothetical protein
MKNKPSQTSSRRTIATVEGTWASLPALSTATQIAGLLQVSPRVVHLWASSGKIPVALRQGKVVRFHPPAVAQALGLDLPGFGDSRGPAEATSSDQLTN